MTSLLLAIPIVGILFVILAGRVSPTGARVAALITSVLNLQLAYLLTMKAGIGALTVSYPWLPAFGVTFALQIDWTAGLMIMLTNVLFVVAIAASWKQIKTKVTSYHVALLALMVGVILVFLARDLMLFYVGWELMLVPAFFLIGTWGTGRKEYSAAKFVLFTFAGSIFMLASIFYLYIIHASQTGNYTFLINDLLKTDLTKAQQAWIFAGFLIGFGVKAPIFPLHSWLPDAYANAPTGTTILLSGILSKTAVFGFFRIGTIFSQDAIYSIPEKVLNEGNFCQIFFSSFQLPILTLLIFSAFYSAWIAFSQRDMKRLIAYSSFSHVNFILIGIFTDMSLGFSGAVLQMITHGLASAALFMIAGAVEERYKTREFEYLGGLWKTLPVLGGFLLFFSFASLGLPGTGNFVAELYIIGAAFVTQWWLGVLAAFVVLFGAVYALVFFTRVMQGPEAPTIEKDITDSSKGEALVLGFLAAVIILLGFFPKLVTKPLQPSSKISQSTLLNSGQELAMVNKSEVEQ